MSRSVLMVLLLSHEWHFLCPFPITCAFFRGSNYRSGAAAAPKPPSHGFRMWMKSRC